MQDEMFLYFSMGAGSDMSSTAHNQIWKQKQLRCQSVCMFGIVLVSP